MMWWLLYALLSLAIGIAFEMWSPRMPFVTWVDRIIFAVLIAIFWPVLVLAVAVMLFA